MIELREVTKRWQGFALEGIDLEVTEGEYLVVLGPSAAGKTLLLEMVAGLHSPDAGRIVIDGVDGSELPPERRRVGFVYQDYALFPHLTVLENVAFGARFGQGLAREDACRTAHELLARVGVTDLADRSPMTLSGGERQRVALVRALAAKPRVLLLDEPLSALDQTTRDELRALLRSIHLKTGVTVVHVTHDRSEAASLADRVVVMMEGRLVQTGTVEEVFSLPTNEAVARFVGVENRLAGTVTEVGEHTLTVRVGENELAASRTDRYAVDDKVRVYLRPENVPLLTRKPKSSARNLLPATVTSVEPLGHVQKVELDCGFTLVALVTPRSVEELGLANGALVVASFKATAVHLLPY